MDKVEDKVGEADQRSFLDMEKLFKIAQMDICLQQLGTLDLYALFDLTVGASIQQALGQPPLLVRLVGLKNSQGSLQAIVTTARRKVSDVKESKTGGHINGLG